MEARSFKSQYKHLLSLFTRSTQLTQCQCPIQDKKKKKKSIDYIELNSTENNVSLNA